jgi:hypothetical protein
MNLASIRVKLLLACMVSGFALQTGFAQRNVRDSVVFSPEIIFHGGFQRPSFDMEERFGDNATIGLAFLIKDKKNWIYGAESSYIFGGTVKEPGLLQNLRTESGEILDNEGRISTVLIQERGYSINLSFGRVFNFTGPNPNCGIMFKAGLGFIQHKIRFEHQINEINQLEGDYLQGYDRLTNGLMLSQFLGYHYMSNSRLANFLIGLEVVEGFTQGRRDLNYDTGTTDTEARFDLLYGVRIGWIVPLYQRQPELFYTH